MTAAASHAASQAGVRGGGGGFESSVCTPEPAQRPPGDELAHSKSPTIVTLICVGAEPGGESQYIENRPEARAANQEVKFVPVWFAWRTTSVSLCE